MEDRGDTCRWEDNIGMDLEEIGRKVVDWIHLAQDRGQAVVCCEHGNEPSGEEFLD
jgi:protein-tyrosine phosphatase